jgi:hypothetical protein
MAKASRENKVSIRERKRGATMASSSSTAVSEVASIDRAWIASELVKAIEAERYLASDTKTRADTPPEPAMGVLYHEIAAADERHAAVIERIATRYGYVPSASRTSSIGQALGQLTEKIVELGRAPMDQSSLDLAAKARSVQWYTAWVSAFEAIGETDSARDLAALLAEEQAHFEALQQSFNRLVEQKARAAVKIKKSRVSAKAAR